MQKPLTIPFYTYYSTILSQKIQLAGQRMERVINHISGRWYCDYCKKYHSKRTVEFDFSDGLTDSICSLGLEAAGVALAEIEPAQYRSNRRVDLNIKQANAAYKKFVESVCD